jgi:GNAT superfamily N-acetyltransferase
LRSGFLYTVVFYFGPVAVWHLYTFERDLEALAVSLLSPPLVYKKDDCGFVLLIATDPQFARMRYGAQLLQWQIKRHRKEFPGMPVVLDTTTNQAQKVYERLGFSMWGGER